MDNKDITECMGVAMIMTSRKTGPLKWVAEEVRHFFRDLTHQMEWYDYATA